MPVHSFTKNEICQYTGPHSFTQHLVLYWNETFQSTFVLAAWNIPVTRLRNISVRSCTEHATYLQSHWEWNISIYSFTKHELHSLSPPQHPGHLVLVNWGLCVLHHEGLQLAEGAWLDSMHHRWGYRAFLSEWCIRKALLLQACIKLEREAICV